MNLTSTKQQFAADMVAAAREFLILLQRMDYLNQSLGAHGFNAGGPNEFKDEDFENNNQQLKASIVYDVMFVLGSTSQEAISGRRNSLLECIPGGLP